MYRDAGGLFWPILVLLFCGPVCAETLSIRADSRFPLNGEPGSERPGFAVEVLERIFSPHDIELDYQLADWSRSLEMVRDGQADCVVGAYKSESPGLAYPKTPLAWDTTAFYVPSESSWQYRGPASIEGLNLGVIAGYGYGEALDAWLAEHQGDGNVEFMHGRQPLRRNLMKLLNGRLDVVVESPFVMESLLRRMDLGDRVREAGTEGPRTPLYFACSPGLENADEILRAYDEGLKMLRREGVLPELLRRYRLPESALTGPATPDAGQ